MAKSLNLKKLRKARNWTRQQMADHFGVNVTTVLRWENKGIPDRGPARHAIEREWHAIEARPLNGGAA